jgi:glycerol kinase
VWKDTAEIARRRGVAARYEPAMGASERDARYGEWLRAVERARDWSRA